MSPFPRKSGKPYYVSAAGTTLVRAGSSIVNSVAIGSVTGDVTIKIYDSATAAGIAASNLKYSIAVSPGVSLTADARVLPLNAYFSSGVVISTAGSTVTGTTTTNLTPQ